jgi:predicted nucleic acid-binding protein
MLYLDTSVLVKRYFQEVGSKAVNSRFDRGEAIYTSVLSFAEVHAAIGRKYRVEELSTKEKKKLIDEFQTDWLFSLNILEMTTVTMIALPSLCEQYSLRASDAVHLSAAFWLKDAIRLRAKGFEDSGNLVEFGVSDRQLGIAALKCGFAVFNPEQVKD